MTEDEILAVYGSIKQLAESMTAREAMLNKKTADLHAAIVQIQQLPVLLGKQTSQYIAAGVRQSMQHDFSLPIAEAIKGPIADLSRETYHAREVMRQVGGGSRFQSFTWISILVLSGAILGAICCYYFSVRDLNQVNDRIDSIQQMMTVPVVPSTPNSKKKHR